MLLVFLVLISAGVVFSPVAVANPSRHCSSRPHARRALHYTSRCGRGAPPRCGWGPPRSIAGLIVLGLGVADQVLLIEHLGHVMEVLFDQHSKVLTDLVEALSTLHRQLRTG